MFSPTLVDRLDSKNSGWCCAFPLSFFYSRNLRIRLFSPDAKNSRWCAFPLSWFILYSRNLDIHALTQPRRLSFLTPRTTRISVLLVLFFTQQGHSYSHATYTTLLTWRQEEQMVRVPVVLVPASVQCDDDEHEALGVEGGPADEENDHDNNWKREK